MDVRPTEGIHIWYSTLSTKISCMLSLSSTLDSPQHSVVRPSTINSSTNSTTSQWPLCQSCGSRLLTLSTKEEEKERKLKKERNTSWGILSCLRLVLIESASPWSYSSSTFYTLCGTHGFATLSATIASIKWDTTTWVMKLVSGWLVWSFTVSAFSLQTSSLLLTSITIHGTESWCWV